MDASVLDRQRARLNALNWTSSEQINGQFNSSDMFTDAVPEWLQFAQQSGHLLMANRGDTPMFAMKNTLSLQNGWPNLPNSVVKSGEENNSGVTAATCLKAPFDSDPSFVEHAAKFSSFESNGQMLPYLKAVPNSSESISNEQQMACSNDSEVSKMICRTASAEQFSDKVTSVAQESIPSEKIIAGNGKFSKDNGGRKRKNDRTKPQEIKAADSEESKEKRTKSGDSGAKEKEDLRKSKTEQSNSDNSVDSTQKSVKENSKASENQKQDYIHVRARRGQATDSHSLAERVRREKISERMKYLQDLVPGCNKVTGKAVMLDEIINYVQSLQRQVEFLSMKLAAVNPRLELNIDNFFAKEMMPPCANFPSLGGMSPDLVPYLQFHPMQQQQASLQAGVCSGFDIPAIVSSADTTSLHRTTTPSVPAEMFGDANFQVHASSAWDTELQNVFSNGLVQGRQTPFASQGLTGHLDINHMKMEL
ncbi:hypothetical protein SUGI_0354150 [Cryptomeria japonica]|nr:hypothetical protein SUGI_0354150 [Cryptomeria japonica]